MSEFTITRHIEFDKSFQGINLTEFNLGGCDGITNDQILDFFIHSRPFEFDSLRDCIKKEPKRGYLGHAFDMDLIGNTDFRKFDKPGTKAYLTEYINDSGWGNESDLTDFKLLVNQYLEIHNQLPDADFYILNKDWFDNEDKRVLEPQRWCYTYYFLIIFVAKEEKRLMISEWTYD